MGIKVTKMQGCGNDFVILDYEEFQKLDTNFTETARKLCDRHFGIGADGLIIPNKEVSDADLGWYFYNSDGSIAQMCGNGMRCFAKYVFDKKLVNNKTFSVKTLAGTIRPEILENGMVRVNMSKPVLQSEKIPFIPVNNLNYKIAVKNQIFEGTAVSMGNPHFVIFIDDENVDLMKYAKEYGPIIETSAEFPEKTNVEFVKVESYSKIEMVVWERGCGITLACGTGACASTVAGILREYLQKSVDVILPGGVVHIDWEGTKENPDKDVFLTGPATYVYEAELY